MHAGSIPARASIFLQIRSCHAALTAAAVVLRKVCGRPFGFPSHFAKLIDNNSILMIFVTLL
ncbi:MAG: hypothetical protein DI555_03040 [Novosphingobium pentaromativorans]|uniref:Uncharacterized protein n=1 Tax=Novosphingobium pentaromativorans TaxID=205844 RepID=A0A2W5QQW1_9SPHN|nr:MAG: hypothetical protein DI555_03040 [Novosphingobium pentaromativorans]